MKQQLPSGQLNAHIATVNVYGTTIRDSRSVHRGRDAQPTAGFAASLKR